MLPSPIAAPAVVRMTPHLDAKTGRDPDVEFGRSVVNGEQDILGTMSVLIVNQEQVTRLLPMDECIDAMQQALGSLARGDGVQPLRSCTWLPDRSGLLGLMPGYLGEPHALGIKVVAIFPGNHGTELDAHQGPVLLFDTTDGRLLAVIDATEITGIRTAAVSAVATRLLARDDAGDLAILGSGTQAWTHLEAMRHARPLRRVRVWSRNPENARRLAERAAAEGVNVESTPTARAAVEDADIICTTTSSHEPVLQGDWLAPGAHINAVGACFATARELDTAAVKRSRLFVDRRESALNEAGDLLIPMAEGDLTADHIVAELGQVITGDVAGRTAPEDITLFKSLGIAVEDLAAAHLIYSKAVSGGGAGSVAVELGGRRH